MTGASKKRTEIKRKLIREMTDYLLNAFYLAVFFGLFTWYKRLILAEYEIPYFNYGAAVVEALVLAKVILVGDAFRLGRRLFAGKPLVFPTLYRAVVFGILVAVFKIAERTVSGLIHEKGLAGGFNELIGQGVYVLLANTLVTFLAFVPFFAFKELGRSLGKGRMVKMFFRESPASTPGELEE